MKTDAPLTEETLRHETRIYRGTGGVSEENRGEGFLPAFMDTATEKVYLSRFASGAVAPLHLLDGLPDEIVVRRNSSGRVTKAKDTLIAGFVRHGRFYTRAQAAIIIQGQTTASARSSALSQASAVTPAPLHP